MDIEKIATIVVDSAFKVHKTLGPGLLESTYQTCLAYELTQRGLTVNCEVALPIQYDGHLLDPGYRIDMLVENCIIIENKAVEQMHPLYEAQLLTYLKLSNYWLGFLINWNTAKIKDGIKRMANGIKPLES